EAEQGVWKPVLGTLGAACVLLAIVGNVVFSPDSPLKKTGTATSRHFVATSFSQIPDPPREYSEPISDFHQAVESSSIAMLDVPNAEQEPHVRLAPQAEPAPQAGLSPVVELAPVAEPAPQVELLPKSNQTVVTLSAEYPILPREATTDVSVADVRPDT